MRPANTPSAQLPKLLDQMRERIRTKNYSIRTEAQYVQWVRRFILYHGKRHPRDVGAPEVEAFLALSSSLNGRAMPKTWRKKYVNARPDPSVCFSE